MNKTTMRTGVVLATTMGALVLTGCASPAERAARAQQREQERAARAAFCASSEGAPICAAQRELALRQLGDSLQRAADSYAQSQQQKAQIYQQQMQRPWNQQFCSAVVNNCAVNVRIVP